MTIRLVLIVIFCAGALSISGHASASEEKEMPPEISSLVRAMAAEIQSEEIAYLTEQCSPEPFNQNIAYPEALQKQNIGGTVTLSIVVNPCGEARSVSIEKSSRNRDIDRAALESAKHWVLDISALERPNKQGLRILIPVNFDPPSNSPRELCIKFLADPSQPFQSSEAMNLEVKKFKLEHENSYTLFTRSIYSKDNGKSLAFDVTEFKSNSPFGNSFIVGRFDPAVSPEALLVSSICNGSAAECESFQKFFIDRRINYSCETDKH